MYNFGEKLKEIRRSKNMYQKDLADKMGVSQQAISILEKSPTVPKWDTLEKIANALDIEPYELLNRDFLPYLRFGESVGKQLVNQASEYLDYKALTNNHPDLAQDHFNSFLEEYGINIEPTGTTGIEGDDTEYNLDAKQQDALKKAVAEYVKMVIRSMSTPDIKS